MSDEMSMEFIEHDYLVSFSGERKLRQAAVKGEYDEGKCRHWDGD